MYPKLKLVTYYNGNAKENFLKLSTTPYEFKVFYCTDPVTEVEIPVTNPNLVVRFFSDVSSYSVVSSKRYITTLGIGTFSIECSYKTDDDDLEIQNDIVIYSPGAYPRLQIEFYKTNIQQTSFMDIANSPYEMRIKLLFTDTESTYISTTDPNLQINVFDRNTFYKVESGVFQLYLLDKGTCQIGAYYTYLGQTISVKQEILVYDTFLKDNFASSGLTTFDLVIYSKNKKYQILLKTLFELFDILYAYQYDINSINDMRMIKNKFLDVVGRSFGFEKRVIYDGTKWEYAYERMYRELLVNLIDLIKARGTKLAYELFFGALGYDIQLLEYWFDKNGNLIEIDPEDFENSTFYAYKTDGNPLSDIQTEEIDPRKDVDASNLYNYCNKSIYVRPVITLKPSLVAHPANESTVYEKILILKYLEWLKPNHIEYLQTIFKISLTGTGEELITFVGGVEHEILEDDPGGLDVADYVTLCGCYIDEDGNFTPLIKLPEIANNIRNVCFETASSTSVFEVPVTHAPTSVDGVWLPSPLWLGIVPIDSNLWTGIAYGNNTFVATSIDGATRSMHSKDGLIWTGVVTPDNSDRIRTVFCDGVFISIALGTVTYTIIRSEDDGATWDGVAIAPALAGLGWSGLASGNGIVIACSSSGEMMRSTDLGITWQSLNTGLAYLWTTIEFGDGVWIAISSDGKIGRSINNGDTWTIMDIPELGTYYGATFGDGVFMACSIDGATHRFIRSDDLGLTWTTITAPELNAWTSIKYGNGMFWAVSLDGINRSCVSYDRGLSFTSVLAPIIPFMSLCFGNGSFVALTNTGGQGAIIDKGQNYFCGFAVGNDLSGGYDWSSSPETFSITIEDAAPTVITLSANCATYAAVINHIMEQLKAENIFGVSIGVMNDGSSLIYISRNIESAIPEAKFQLTAGVPNNALTTLGWDELEHANGIIGGDVVLLGTALPAAVTPVIVCYDLEQFPYWTPPIGDPLNLENDYFGVWAGHSFNRLYDTFFGRNRSLIIEHLPVCFDEVIVGDVIELQEFLETPIVYDSIYEYDESTPESIGIKYDRGILLSEDDLSVIDFKLFGMRYTNYINTHSASQTLTYLADLYGITEELCQIMINEYLAS